MKVLAEQYQGEIQFAVVNSHKSELMRSTFGVRSLPAEFYYKDGTWYEQNFMQVLINNIRTFIDERHLNEGNRYQMFETPYLIPKFAMPIKRQYNKLWEKWINGWNREVVVFFRDTIVYDDKSIHALLDPYLDLEGVYKSGTRMQIYYILWVAGITASILLIIALCMLRCLWRCCCGRGSSNAA